MKTTKIFKLTLLVILFTIIFSGCVAKIDFKQYQTIKQVKNPKYTRINKLPLPIENIQIYSLINNYNQEILYQLFKLSNRYYKYFENIDSNTKVDIYLTELGYTKEFIPEQKKQKKQNSNITTNISNNNTIIKNQIIVTNNYMTNNYRQYGKYRIQYYAKANVKFKYNHHTYLFDAYLSDQFIDKMGYIDKKYNINYNEIIKYLFDDIFYRIRRKLNPPFKITEIKKNIKKPNTYAIKIDGGTCNYINKGEIASLYDKNFNLRATGEVSQQSTCNFGWLKFEDISYKPKLSDIIILDFKD